MNNKEVNPDFAISEGEREKYYNDLEKERSNEKIQQLEDRISRIEEELASRIEYEDKIIELLTQIESKSGEIPIWRNTK